MTTYHILRMYRDHPERNRRVKTGLSLEEAQAYCKNPETSSQTCKESRNLRRTKVWGPWFDAYGED